LIASVCFFSYASPCQITLDTNLAREYGTHAPFLTDLHSAPLGRKICKCTHTQLRIITSFTANDTTVFSFRANTYINGELTQQ